MSWSLGEIQALTVKAARGSGHPWGVADEAGWAVRWLSGFGLPGPEAMAFLLDSVETGGCPLALGLAVSDSRQIALANDVEVSQPLLLLPFLARAANPGQTVRVEIADVFAEVSPNGVAPAGPMPDRGLARISVRKGALSNMPTYHRIERIAPEALETLERLAHRTYAPATEASRNSGAGAGLTDND